MPIYAYKCETCGHAKDVLQKMSDPLLTDCPACGASTFKKQLTAAGFQLKGSGWYATDFKNGGTPAATVPVGEKSDSGASVSTDAKTDTKTDTSPGDSKTEAKSVTKTETSATTQSTTKPAEGASSKPAAASGSGCAAGCGCH